MDHTEHPNYFAIIPAPVRYDPALPAAAKLLYGELTALARAEGYAWASNSYFANLYKVDKSTVSGWVGQLAARGYIRVEVFRKESGYERRVWILQTEGAPAEAKAEKPKRTRREAAEPLDKLSPAMSLARLLGERHAVADPGFTFTDADIGRWAVDIDRLMRLDGRTKDQIERVICWSQASDFWCANIISGRKVREKFPTLWLQMNNTAQSHRGRPASALPDYGPAPAAPTTGGSTTTATDGLV